MGSYIQLNPQCTHCGEGDQFMLCELTKNDVISELDEHQNKQTVYCLKLLFWYRYQVFVILEKQLFEIC